VGLGWERRSPALFYAVLFLVAFQIGTLFTDVRALAGFASTVVNARLARWSGR
jgi:hypothetical protein